MTISNGNHYCASSVNADAKGLKGTPQPVSRTVRSQVRYIASDVEFFGTNFRIGGNGASLLYSGTWGRRFHE